MNELMRKLYFWKAEMIYLCLAKRDANIKNLLKEQIAQEYLNKHYVLPYYRNKKKLERQQQGLSKHCWIYWKQGVDKAPDIVKKCVKSIDATFNTSGWRVHILDMEEAKKLTDIPDYIWEKNKNGYIKDAHLADLIRLNLINRNGGCWVDATVLFSGTEVIPSFLYDEGFFMFRNYMKNDSYINISNWLIYSDPHNPLINDTYEILLDYWKKEKVFIQYYGFHLIFKLVTDHYLEYWKTLTPYSNIPPHVLQEVLLEQYNSNTLKKIFSVSMIHKLKWRVPEKPEKDSYLYYLLNDC